MMDALRDFFYTFRSAVSDHDRDLNERLYLIYSVLAEIAVAIALVGDILIKESKTEILLLIGVLISNALLTIAGLYKGKLKLSIAIIMSALVFVILPVLYFFGGGIHGGGMIWFIFGFMYVGMLLTGRWRNILMVVLICMCFGFIGLERAHPEIVSIHSIKESYIDVAISLVLVGSISFLMTWFQTAIFREENERAKKETERAEELSRAQNRFFSNMSHEIRTPINSILGLNELILRDETASPEIAKDAAGIEGSGKMLLALINDILDFSKIEAGSMDIVSVDYKVGNMLSEVVSMIWIRARDKGLKFDVSVDPGVPSGLYGDEVRIKQIIINLLNNAVKYTKEGSIGLHIEAGNIADGSVELSIVVSDTGMGIKKEALPYLFDAFKRVDEEKNRHIEGTGLGLSIVKQLVELMNGTITVNSVYGEGSEFVVVIKQGISDMTEIGELNIHNQKTVKRSTYESSFKAPNARILIVDDNEMNLEVESRLLADTQVTIDKALSGKAALKDTVTYQYDVILMDHLMPGMDGIDCLEGIRKQAGGLNRTTPVIVLTANAGSENRELYHMAGFDGYLVKPVSGEALEEALIRHIQAEKLILSSRMLRMREDINTASGYLGKAPVIITSTSMCDLPDSVVKKMNVAIIPFMIRTEEGIFKDGIQMGADELIRYMNAGKNADSLPPEEAAYTVFFAETLKRAHNLIHISITTSMSKDYPIAKEAARAFENVTIVNSECLSSATGLLVMIACKLAQQSIPVPEIVEELEKVKKRLKCSFIIDQTGYMARRGLISQRVHSLARALNVHPSLRIKDDRSGIGGAWLGSTKKAYKNYIKSAFPVDIIPDSDVVYITYVDVPVETLIWIEEEISKVAYFEHVVFKQASAAISSNCGPGTFGILYFVKANKSYNIGSFIDDEHVGYGIGRKGKKADETYDEVEYDSVIDEETDALDEDEENSEAEPDTEMNDQAMDPGVPAGEEQAEKKWYEKIEGIDPVSAIKNSGSEDGFKTVLKIFYESIPVKKAEIEGFYEEDDLNNYTIKVHALKSSARLIGAGELADKAQLLEDAGKAEDRDYIKANHEPFMQDYLKYEGILAEVFGGGSGSSEEKPMADEFLMESVYDGLRTAAEEMDCDAVEEILKELEGYEIPGSEKEKFESLIEKAEKFDYDGMLEVLSGND